MPGAGTVESEIFSGLIESAQLQLQSPFRFTEKKSLQHSREPTHSPLPQGSSSIQLPLHAELDSVFSSLPLAFDTDVEESDQKLMTLGATGQSDN